MSCVLIFRFYGIIFFFFFYSTDSWDISILVLVINWSFFKANSGKFGIECSKVMVLPLSPAFCTYFSYLEVTIFLFMLHSRMHIDTVLMQLLIHSIINVPKYGSLHVVSGKIWLKMYLM